jgi:lipopolysaccharide exporter
MARILEPGDFGLYTEANLVFSALTIIIELPLLRALVRMPGDRQEVARATFGLAIVMGFTGMLLCAFSGWPISMLYNEPRLVQLMLILAPAVLIDALGVVPHAILVRELEFRRRILPESIAVMVGAVLGIAAAFLGAGVYSLVIYAMTRVILNCLVAWLIVRWKPGRGFGSWQTWKEVLNFGLPASGGELAQFARFNVDFVIGGMRLGTSALGVYNLAWKTTEIPARIINASFDTVGYATFSRLQTDKSYLQRMFLTATSLLASITLPLFLGAAFVREELVAVALGPKWAAAADVILPLFLLQILWVISHPSAGLSLALGHSRVYAFINTFSLVFSVIVLLIGAGFGITGIAWAMLLSTGLTSLTWCVLAWRYSGATSAATLKAARLPFFLTCSTLPPIILVHVLTGMVSLPALVRLVLAVLAGLAGFAVVARLNWVELKGNLALLRQALPEEKVVEQELAEAKV